MAPAEGTSLTELQLIGSMDGAHWGKRLNKFSC